MIEGVENYKIPYNSPMPFTTLFFDLDDTLYPSASGLWNAIRDRMSLYMIERLHIPADQVPELRRHYFETYGTTLRGLQIHHQVDADEYLAYVHDLPLEKYIQPNPQLRELISSLPQRCWIFTNADDGHAHRVLDQLGLDGCFVGIIDIKATQFICKPDIDAYRKALSIAGCVDARNCAIVEDSPRNLVPARSLGFYTILLGDGGLDPAADLCVTGLLDLKIALPDLWE